MTTSKLQWLIIGGGIHGTFMANLFVNRLGFRPDDLRVLDPHDRLLAVWLRNTTNCGMSHLRSPATHNIDLHALSLYRYARSPAGSSLRDFIPPYNRPSLELFRRHCEHVIKTNRLEALGMRGRAHALRNTGSSITVDTTAGKLKTRNVMLAIGLGEQPDWPGWARSLQQQGADIRHLFEPDFDRRTLKSVERTAVIGGGITAAQVALKLAEEQEDNIVVLSGHELREQYYDFNPCWIGRKCLADYYKLDFRRRREIIDQERVPGTIPAEVLKSFLAALDTGNPRFERGTRHRCRIDGCRHSLAHRTRFAMFRPGYTGHRFSGQASRQSPDRTGDCRIQAGMQPLRLPDHRPGPALGRAHLRHRSLGRIAGGTLRPQHHRGP